MIGDSIGNVSMLDLRTGRRVRGFHGFAGAIRSIHVHPTQDIVAVVGLDRFARTFNINNRHVISKVYLKQRLQAVLCDAEPFAAPARASTKKRSRHEAEAEAHEDDADEEDSEAAREAVWEALPEAGSKKARTAVPSAASSSSSSSSSSVSTPSTATTGTTKWTTTPVRRDKGGK